jgi:transposase
MPKLYTVALTDSERTHLRALVRSGRGSARMLTRVRILLLADDGRSDLDIAHSLQCGHATVERVRRRCVTDGLLAALQERPRPGAQPKLDGKREALLVALACSEPPTDRAEWTMQLLADKLVAIGAVDTISDETVRRVLKKTTSSRG